MKTIDCVGVQFPWSRAGDLYDPNKLDRPDIIPSGSVDFGHICPYNGQMVTMGNGNHHCLAAVVAKKMKNLMQKTADGNVRCGRKIWKIRKGQ